MYRASRTLNGYSFRGLFFYATKNALSGKEIRGHLNKVDISYASCGFGLLFVAFAATSIFLVITSFNKRTALLQISIF